MDANKFVNYLLNPGHSIGAHKAKVFAACGYTQSNWVDFANAIATQVPQVPGRSTKHSTYGEHYEATISITSTTGEPVDVVTAWIVEADETRFLTAYPARRTSTTVREEGS